MSLWSWSAGPAVPDTLLSHSLIETVNSPKKNTEQTDLHKHVAHWHQLFTLPASGVQEIAGFRREKQQVEAVKARSAVTARSPVSAQLSYRDVLRLTDRLMCKRAGATVTDENKPNI